MHADPPVNVLTFDDDFDFGVLIEEETLDTVEDEPQLGLEVDADRIKCGEIVLICHSRRSIRFICSICGRELSRLDAFLRHTLQYHSLAPEGQLQLEAVLTAATLGDTTDAIDALENAETHLEHYSPVAEFVHPEHVKVEDEDVATEMSYGEVEMLEEALEQSALEEQNIKTMASTLYETQQLKSIQNIDDGLKNAFDGSNLSLKLDKWADSAYNELTECFELDIKYDNTDELSGVVETNDETKVVKQEFEPTEKQFDEDETFEIEFLNDEEEENVANEINMVDEATFKKPNSGKIKQPATLFPCEFCSNTFRSRAHLKMHARQHTNTVEKKSYSCEYCDATFTNSSNLKVHRYRHLGIKPHQCALCDKAFISSSELKLHTRTHTGERPYHCAECGQTFVCSAHLSAHRRRHTNERAWVCPICDKAFYDRGQLREHARGHSDARPFVCEQCGLSFTRRKSLVEHEKLHADVKKYFCTFCKMEFAQNAGLHSHIRAKHALQR